jgi:hypothetical protein
MNSSIARIYTNGNERVVVSYEEPDSPRDWETTGVMACAHKKYALGDKDTALDIEKEGSWKACEKWLEQNALVWLPLSLYDHGGITISVGTGGDKWDSGQVGFIYAGEADFKQAGLNPENPIEVQRVEETLYSEVESYDQYLRGEGWGWSQQTRSECSACGRGEWEEVDSSFGFLGEHDVSDIDLDFDWEASIVTEGK